MTISYKIKSNINTKNQEEVNLPVELVSNAKYAAYMEEVDF